MELKYFDVILNSTHHSPFMLYLGRTLMGRGERDKIQITPFFYRNKVMEILKGSLGSAMGVIYLVITSCVNLHGWMN